MGAPECGGEGIEPAEAETLLHVQHVTTSDHD